MSFSEWKRTKLKNVCVINKNSYSAKENWKFINYLDTGNITENKIDLIQHLIVGTDKIPSRAKRKVFKDDIIYSTVRPNQKHYGIMKEVCENILVSTGFAVITCKEDLVVSDYLYYYLTQQHIVESLHTIGENSTSAYPSIKPSDLEKVDLFLPDLKEQKAIAATLSYIDDKIELNNRINDNLLQMAQAIFKSWFVDFEPFQDGEFEDSELGMIPKGWGVGSLGDISSISSGKRPRIKEITASSEISIPVIGASSIMAYTNESLYEEPILVTGRVGTHGVVQRFSKKCWPSDNTLVIKSKYYEFVDHCLKGVDFNSINRGSTQPLITQTDLKNIRIIKPLEDVLLTFESLISNLMVLWEENNRLNKTLSETRDTLLPKLMSGEIRVPVEEV